jgi:hypothetical protein
MGLKEGDCTKETGYDPYKYEAAWDPILGAKHGNK